MALGALGGEPLLAALPADTYARMRAPRETVSSCIRTVARAVAQRNPRLIELWIDDRTRALALADVATLVDIALDHVGAGLYDADEINGIADARREMRAHVERARERTTDAAVECGIVEGLVLAMGLYDPAIVVHCEAVAALAGRLADYTTLPRRAARAVVVAARIHEIGRLDAGESGRVAFARTGKRLQDKPGLADAGAVVAALAAPDWRTMPDEAQILDLADAFVTISTLGTAGRSLNVHAAVTALHRDRDRYNPLLLERLMDVLRAGRVPYGHAPYASVRSAATDT